MSVYLGRSVMAKSGNQADDKMSYSDTLAKIITLLWSAHPTLDCYFDASEGRGRFCNALIRLSYELRIAF